MSKFRPNSNLDNIYCIGDIHGNYKGFKLMLDRIMPLSKNSKLILLGDLIDRGSQSYEVIETIINLRKKYPKDSNQLIILRGNHEQLLLNALSLGKNVSIMDSISDYSMWLKNGGCETISCYSSRLGVEIENPRDLPRLRCLSFIDERHIKFIQEETQLYYELNKDDYKFQFAHAAIDPHLPIEQQDEEVLLWDRSLYANIKSIIAQGKQLPWANEKTIITGHNYDGIYFTPGFMMIDSYANNYLSLVELNTMECMTALNKNTDRLVRKKIVEAQIRPVNSRHLTGL